MTRAAQITFISITSTLDFSLVLESVLRAKVAILALELALLAVHLGCPAPESRWRDCSPSLLGGWSYCLALLWHLVNLLNKMPSLLNFQRPFSCSQKRVRHKLRTRVL